MTTPLRIAGEAGGIEIELEPDRVPDLTLSLVARPDEIAVVRQALTGVAEVVGLDPDVLSDLKTAISEACNNVVVHAYGGESGPLRVAVSVAEGRLVVAVADQGRGLSSPRVPDAPGQGVGLSLIYALSEEVDVTEGEGGGTTVRMTFPVDAHRVPAEESVVAAGAAAAGPVIAAVLGRVVAMLAARASFSLDRLSDAQLVSDALSAHAPTYVLDGVLRLSARDVDHTVVLRVGPLVKEGAPGIVRDSELPGVGLLLEQLVDEREVEPAGDPADGEFLGLRLVERGAAVA